MLSVIGTTNPKLQLPRTPFGVAWSCILTVFICAWTSGHPNVPPQDGIARGLARIKVTFWTIAAPELVLVWAVRQWREAGEVIYFYNIDKGMENSPRDNVSDDRICRIRSDTVEYETWLFPSHGWLPTRE